MSTQQSNIPIVQFQQASVSIARLPVSKEEPNGHFQTVVRLSEIVLDLLGAASGVIFSHWLYEVLELGKQVEYPISLIYAIAFAFGILIVLLLERDGAYNHTSSLLRIKETERVLRIVLNSFLLIFPVTFFAHEPFSRWMVALTFINVPLFLFVQKQLLYEFVSRLHSKGYGVRNVLIYGSGHTGRRVFSALARSPKLGLQPVAFVDDDPAVVGSTIPEMSYQRTRRSVPVVQGPICKDVLSRFHAGLVVIAIHSLSRPVFLKTVNELLASDVKVSFVSNSFAPSDPWVNYEDIDGLLLASFGRVPTSGTYELLKKVFDFSASLMLLMIASPVLLGLAALVRFQSEGPAFFTQTRVGKNGKLFKIWKFRTMHADAPAYDYSPRACEDPRITPIGRFLRRTSLDELPQLVNVLQGEMSLVGPRPEMPFIVQQYTERQRQRLQVQPGITGIWQISADRDYPIHENIQYDFYYIRNRSFLMDMAIILHTVVFGMRGI